MLRAVFVCDGGVSTPLILIRVNNQPLLLQEMLFLSQCAVRPASAIASSQIPEWSQLSDMIITEQSFIVSIRSNPIYLFCCRVTAFVRKILSRAGLWSDLFSLVSRPALKPRSCLRSLRRLLRLLVGMMIHGLTLT